MSDAWRTRTPIQRARFLLERHPSWQAAQDDIYSRLTEARSQQEKNYWQRTLGELRRMDGRGQVVAPVRMPRQPNVTR